MREVANKNVTLDSLIGRLISFEMNNYDNNVLPTIESAFKFSLKIRKSSNKHTMRNDSDEQELDELEALISRIFGRGKGKSVVRGDGAELSGRFGRARSLALGLLREPLSSLAALRLLT